VVQLDVPFAQKRFKWPDTGDMRADIARVSAFPLETQG